VLFGSQRDRTLGVFVHFRGVGVVGL